MQLHNLKSPRGSRKKKFIIGRGRGSGKGRTSGRGQKGQTSRSGRATLVGSEGGQMPLIRRLPKIGFASHRPVINQVVNVEELNTFDKGAIINAELLKKAGLIKSLNKPFKILGDGELKKALILQAGSVSKTAQEKIEKAGGKVEIIGAVKPQEHKKPVVLKPVKEENKSPKTK
ncbi:MAG: 50S ribosomal protein L15 [Candidatus Omnitrophica bacterium]|nr:50S ribosomal protein L15 [Candidatus Omnitrophota bacterium]